MNEKAGSHERECFPKVLLVGVVWMAKMGGEIALAWLLPLLLANRFGQVS